MKQHNPELFSLSLVGWQLFGTLTFDNKTVNKSERIKLAMFFALLRTQAGNFGLHFKRMMWVLRRENGEATGRFHYHFLIAGLPPHVVHFATCNSTEKIWVRLGGGHARVTEYNPRLGAVDYILKRGDEIVLSVATRFAADYYELMKFGSSCDLMLSESLCDHLFQRTSVGRWARGGVCKDRRESSEQAKRSNRPALPNKGSEFHDRNSATSMTLALNTEFAVHEG
jgi:hypothetical protein